YKGKYKLGDTIKFVQRADQTGSKVLKRTQFRIVGFVYSPEVLSAINKGDSTSGSGDLKGYGVVTANNFDSDFYMMARITYQNTQKLDPYSDQYT
ncbi:ABC transporter permease, partial [Paenibacillus polymyxa]|nr:ABC transporter permease [Paenibacillus polymyxa]